MTDRPDETEIFLLRWWRNQGLPARAGALALLGAVLGLLIGSVILVTRPEAEEQSVRVVVNASTPSAVEPTVSGTSTPEATATVVPTPTPEPTAADDAPTVHTLRELVEQHGDPPDSTLGRMRIPSLGIDAPLGIRVVAAGDDVMPNPTGPGDVVWYDLSEWEKLGGSPGEGNNAIFSGHVDYAAYVAYADVQFRGRGVFYSLSLLSPGDVVEVDMNGETLRYEVEWRRQVPAGDANWAEIFSGEVVQDSITLYTCSGDFDFATRSYSDRTVVRATRI